MKKYLSLLNKKKKLEKKIAKICNKFTDSTGLIIKNAEMNIDVNNEITKDLEDKLLTNYKVEINCEL
jgi:hypothetical protein